MRMLASLPVASSILRTNANAKHFERDRRSLINLQDWAKGLLRDNLPLEVLYAKRPDTSEDVVIMKADEKIIIVRNKLSADELIWLLVQTQINKAVNE